MSEKNTELIHKFYIWNITTQAHLDKTLSSIVPGKKINLQQIY